MISVHVAKCQAMPTTVPTQTPDISRYKGRKQVKITTWLFLVTIIFRTIAIT